MNTSLYCETNRIGGVMVIVSSLVDRVFEPRSGQTKDYEIDICCCFSTNHAAFRRKSKDWLARNQDNVSSWCNMSIRGLLFQWVTTIKMQLSVLVEYKADLIIISLKINLFSSWYSWKIAAMAITNNHSLTYSNWNFVPGKTNIFIAIIMMFVLSIIHNSQEVDKNIYLTLYTFSVEINESRLVIKEWRDVARDVLCGTTLTWRHTIGMWDKTQ